MMRLHILHKTRSVKTRSESGKPASRWIRYLRPASRKPCIAASSQRLRSTRFSYGQSALRYALGFTGPDNWRLYRTNGRVAVGMEISFSVRWSKRLGFRLAAHERPTAVLARNVVAILRQAGFAACQGDEASFVSHLSAHLWDAAECKRGEFQGRTGTASPRESESHDRRVHAGGPQKREAQSNLVKLVRKARFWRSSLPKWIKLDHEEKRWCCGSLLFYWRPRRDLNPCYRRERAMS